MTQDETIPGRKQRVEQRRERLVALRREFHEYPELGHHEHRTQGRVLEELGRCGIACRPCGGTGVVGLIRGAADGPTLMLRADLDALPVTEEADVEFASRTPGCMHACGHDAHTAMLIVAAEILAEEGLPRGNVKLMFQPAEEGGGGARKMIEDGVLEDPPVDASLAFHVWTGFETGQVAAISGPVAASVDGFEIRLEGRGTHAAVPEDGVDPLAIGAQLVVAAQQLVTRRIAAQDPAVLSFTSIQGGEAFNVIPEQVRLRGTFRTFDRGVRDRLRRDLEQLAANLAASFGATASYDSLVEHIPVINDDRIAVLAREAAADVDGVDELITPKPLMVGEDIGEVQELVPGALVLLGCGNEALQATYPHHHPRFKIDEAVLPVGVSLFLESVDRYLRL